MLNLEQIDLLARGMGAHLYRVDVGQRYLGVGPVGQLVQMVVRKVNRDELRAYWTTNNKPLELSFQCDGPLDGFNDYAEWPHHINVDTVDANQSLSHDLTCRCPLCLRRYAAQPPIVVEGIGEFTGAFSPDELQAERVRLGVARLAW